MKLIESSSRWGNMYRHRYYIDGKRVKKSEFDKALKWLESRPHNRESDNRVGFFRITWQEE